MSLFQKVLEELSKKIKKNEGYKKEISLLLEREIGIVFNEDALVINKTTLKIIVSPTIKSALFLKKAHLLEQLAQYNIYSIE